MRVAFVGKGGAGKSAIAGTFARLLARAGGHVLAIDSDPLPGLAFSVGVPQSDAPLPDDVVEERPEGAEGPRFRLRADLTPEEAVRRYAVEGPDGVRFLQFGKSRGHIRSLMRAQAGFRQIIAGLDEERWDLVGDLPGGTRQPFFGWGDYADTILIVVEPTAKSMLSARRLSRLALGQAAPTRLLAVASKTREADDVGLIEARTGLDVVAAVPFDEALADAEREGRAPVDAAPSSAAVLAVGSLLERLQEVRA